VILHTLDARDQFLDHIALRARALFQHLDLPLGNPKLLGNQVVILLMTIDSIVQSFQVLVDTTETGLNPLIHGVHLQAISVNSPSIFVRVSVCLLMIRFWEDSMDVT